MLADKVASAELSVELGWLVAGTGKLAVLEGHRVFACHTFGRLIRRREMGGTHWERKLFPSAGRWRLGKVLWDR